MPVGAMFGAPVGISAAEDQINQNQQATLTAVKTLGEIAKQPAETELASAHARLFSAEAAAKENEAAAYKRLMELSGAAAANGQLATVDDAPGGKPPSQAEPFIKMLQLGGSSIPVPVRMKLATQVATIQQKEASAAMENSKKVSFDTLAQKRIADRVSGLAQAALDNPDQYDLLRAQAASEGLPVDKLPQAFDAAKITALRDSAMTAGQKLDLKRKQAQADSVDALHRSTEALQDQKITQSRGTVELEKARLTKIQRDGGTGTGSVAEARDSMNTRREVLNQQQLDKMYPPAPLDPNLRKEGQTYRTATGIPFTWNKDPATGKMVAVPQTVSPKVAAALSKRVTPAAPAPRVSAAAALEPDDGEEGDDE